MKNLLLFCLLVFSHLSFGQTDILDARNMGVGATVTITGIITNGAELGPIRYIQDATGGLAVYSPGNFADMVKRGDEVQVTGVLKDYQNLLEIDPVSDFTIISSGNASPTPQIITPNDLGEDYEGELIKIENATFSNAGGVFSANKSYTLNTNGGGSTSIYVRTSHPWVGGNIPLAEFNLTAIASQYQSNYQIIPRDLDDLEIVDAFFITGALVQSNIQVNSFDLAWNTNLAGSTSVRYGTTTDMTETVEMGGSTTDHTLTLSNLEPATFYYVQAYSTDGMNNAESNVLYFSTASNSSGDIAVYFNHIVDPSFSNGANPVAVTPNDAQNAIIDRINAATKSIDVSMYNNDRTPIVTALNQAVARGVVVRYITDSGTGNLALSPADRDFTVFKVNSAALMHNKYFVFDWEDEDNSWLITGSMNLTVQNVVTDYNNMILIQDQALAKAYKAEFDEMWGTDGPQPQVFNSAVGDAKTNNTPHNFVVNGINIESRFSPSDNTTTAIENALKSANNDLQFALLSFTKNELGFAIRNAHLDGVDVRGIIENTGDQGTEFAYLQAEGVNVVAHPPGPSIHHKYAIIDANDSTSDPIVITGSHNWSASAENVNDENTIFIHDADIANIFMQEFEQRWCEINNPGGCFTSVTEQDELLDFNIKVFPNPSTDFVQTSLKADNIEHLSVSLLNANGRYLQARFYKKVNQDWSETISLKGYAPGVYWIQFVADGAKATKKVIVQ